jgi:hypothetical protein
MPKRRRITKKQTQTKTKTTTRKRVSKAVCKKQTLKKYLTRPSPPYPAALCSGKKKKGNDGLMYISKPGINYGSPKWVKV